MAKFLLVLALIAAPASGAVIKQEASPAISSVLSMLRNIVSMVQTESTQDETEHTQFQEWSVSEKATVLERIGQLQTEIQTTNAALTDLKAQSVDLQTTITRVSAELSSETAQLNSATQRRNEENAAFVTEEQNFDNAISACAQAVKLLAAHYGDGSAQSAGKPGFLSLLNKAFEAVNSAAKKVKSTTVLKKLSGSALFQKAMKQPNNNAYQDSSADAGGIVDEVRAMSGTFSEDKQSSAAAESALQRAYDTLHSQKSGMINTLAAELSSQQSQLNEVSQGIAENEGKMKMAEELVADRQSYQTNLGAQLNAANVAYDARKTDREAELEAVNEAIGVLEKVALLETSTSVKKVVVAMQMAHFGQGQSWAKRIESRATKVITKHLRSAGLRCANCAKAAALLREKASMLHSSTLASAAATALGNDQLRAVADRLKQLIDNLDSEQKTESDHKSWCETEQRRTKMTRDGHAYSVDTIQQEINSLKELIGMKQTEYGGNRNDVSTEDTSFTEQTQIRNTDHQEYDENMQDAQDAIAAMNQALDILAKFYASRKSAALIQGKTSEPGGKEVVDLLSNTRKTFEVAESQLKSTEQAEVQQYGEARANHVQSENDLEQDGNVITVEKQTAAQALDSNEDDLSSNQGEIAAAEQYIARLGMSCNPLIQNYDQRKQLRGEEKAAIQDAIKVLQEV